MFTPSSQVDLIKLWDTLGTAYNGLDDTSKEVVETLWTSIFEATGAMYYDLYQNHLGRFFDYTQGYIEQAYQKYDIVFYGDDKNVDETYFLPPSGVAVSNSASVVSGQIYSYKITCLTDDGETTPSLPGVLISGATDLSANPNVVSWSAVSGITSYRVYGRGANSFSLMTTTSSTTYTDDGTASPSGSIPTSNSAIAGYTYHLDDDLYYMTMPTLSGYTTGQVLTEGTDYEIEDLKKIKFLKPISATDTNKILYNTSNTAYEKGESFLNKSSICLLPLLTSVYFQGYGVTDPNDIIASGSYQPFLSGYNDMSYYDQRKNYATHLSKLGYAMSNVLRREPSISNMQHGYGLVMGFPFSYEDGTVTATGIDSNYKYMTISSSGLSDVVYAVPSITHYMYNVGDSVDKFDLLVSGAHSDDYLTDFTMLSGISLKYGEVKEYDVFTQELTDTTFKYKTLSSIIDDVTDVKQSSTYSIDLSETPVGSIE